MSGTSSTRTYALADRQTPPLFGKVVCGLDSTPASREAARQAAILAGPDGRVVLVCAGGGPDDDAAIAAAISSAEDLGAAPTAQLWDGRDAAAALLERVDPNDLLVVGSHGTSRPEGILSGSVATTLLHRAESPVLVARTAPTARPFPRDLLVASDNSPASHEAIRLADAIALRHHGDVSHFHAESGPAHQAIVDRARERRCSLVVVGSRGLGGLRALGSVSERVGHNSPCSVLVVRPPAGS